MQIFDNAIQILKQHTLELNLPKQLNSIYPRLNYPRRGWLKRNVHENQSVESALQHTAKLALAAEAINPETWGIDKQTLRQQCLIHELAEILGTDWTPGEISNEEKFLLEQKQLEELLSEDFPERQKIIDLWEQYEQGGLAYYLDKMDAVITAEYYALVNPNYLQVANEFFQNAFQKIQDNTLRKIMESVQHTARSPQKHLNPLSIFPYYFSQLDQLTHHDIT